MPFPHSTFDCIESWVGIGNIQEFSGVIAQSYRVLNSEGRFTVSGVYDLKYFDPWFLEGVSSLFPNELEKFMNFMRRNELILTRDEVASIMRSVGFHKIESLEHNEAYIVTGEKP